MYNLPYVSYGIFAFVLAAVGLLAWKKGFKAALASLVLSLATVGVILALTLVLFDRISPLFDSYLEKHFSGGGNYDYKILADAAKPQIIAVCIAIGFIPVFGCLFGVTYPIYRFMKKKDFPVTLKTLSSNSKKIKTSNSKLNKIGAITATSVTAVLTAGVATSATGVAFTTASSYNVFNDAISLLSYGTTYGFTKDSYSLHRMYDIIPLTKNQTLMNFAKVIAPNSQKQLTPAEVQAIVDDSQYKELSEIITDSETEEILSFIASPGAKDYDNNITYAVAGEGIGTNFKVLQNAWRPLGNETAPEVYAYDLSQVHGLFDGLGVYFGFNDSTKAKLVDWIKNNGIQKFENTEANRIVQNKADELNKLNEEISKANALLSERQGYLSIFISQKDAAIKQAKTYFASAVSQTKDYNNRIAQGGFIATSQPALDKAVGDRDTARANRDAAGFAFEQYTGYAQSNDVNSAPTNPGQVVNSGAPLQSLISAYNSRVEDRRNQSAENDRRVAESARLAQAIKTNNTTIQSLQPQLSAKGKEKSDKDDEVSNLQKVFNIADGALTAAQTHKDSVSSQLATLNKELKTLEAQNPVNTQAVAAKKAEITQKNGELNTAVDDFTKANNARIEANDEYAAAVAQQKTITDEYNSLNNQISSLTNQVASDTSTKSSLDSQINAWNNTTKTVLDKAVQDAKTQVDDAQKQATILFDDYTRTWNIWKPAQLTADSLISAQNSRINDANQVLKSLKASVDGYNEQIGIVERARIQQAILEWTSNNLSEQIAGIGIDQSLKAEFSALPDTAINFDTQTGKYTINQANISGSQTPTTYVVQAALAQTQLDTSVRKDLDDSVTDNYKFSIPYLANDKSHTAISIDVNNSLTLGGKPAPISTKNVDLISLGTEGKIAVLEFNKNQNELETKNYLIPYREEKKVEFDKNVKEYLDIFNKHLGTDPNKKP